MSRRLPFISNADYTTYDFTPGSEIGYNYDTSGSTAFDPYTDTYDSSPASPVREDWHSRYARDRSESRQVHEGRHSRHDRIESRGVGEDWRSRYDRPESRGVGEDWRSRHDRPESRRVFESSYSRYDRLESRRIREDSHSRYDPHDSRRAHEDPPLYDHLKSRRSPGLQPGPPMATSPSIEYLSESQKASAHLSVPTEARKLLILDLNGTLVFRTSHVRREFRPTRRHVRAAQAYDHQHHDCDSSYSAHALPKIAVPTPDPGAHHADHTPPRPLRTVHPRPYMPVFREYLFHPSTRAWLDTMVWSSAQPHSVADMVERCFGSQQEELLAVWARDTLGLEERDYHRKTQTTKDLSKPWSKLSITPSASSSPSSDTDTPQAHSAHTTLLMDDSPRKAHLQPYNHLCIREYTGALRQMDLQCHQREQRSQQTPISQPQADTKSTPETTHTFPPTSSRHANPVSPPLSPLTTPISPFQSTKKREHLKMKRAEHEHEPAEPEDELSLGLGGYDPTLLAVVGVLERIKWEGNVAGWVRSGGLAKSYLQEAEAAVEEYAEKSQDKGEKEQQEVEVKGEGEKGACLSTGTSAPQDPKRRRVSGEERSLTFSDDGDIVPASSPPSSPLASAASTTALEGDTGQWFEDKTVLRFWVRKGVKALKGLGIEVNSGIVG